MINKKTISNLASLAVSGLLIALFIFLLPSILIIIGVLVLLMIVAALVVRFLIYKEKIKMNFVYRSDDFERRKSDFEEIHEMKDVTNSVKTKKAKE